MSPQSTGAPSPSNRASSFGSAVTASAPMTPSTSSFAYPDRLLPFPLNSA
jgi:hypothetical protein